MPCSTCKHCKKKLQQKNKSQETSDTDTTNAMASHHCTNDESKENEDPMEPSRAWIKNVGPGSCKKFSTGNKTRSSRTKSTTKTARQLYTTKAVVHHVAVDITTMMENEAHSHSTGIERFETIEILSDDNCEADTSIREASAIQTKNDDTVKHLNGLRSGLKNSTKPIFRTLAKQASDNIILRYQNSEWTSIPAVASKPKQDNGNCKKLPFNAENQTKQKTKTTKTARQLITTNEIDVDITAMMENTHLHSTRIETSDDICEADSTSIDKASSIQTKIDDTMKVLYELGSGLGNLAKPIDPTPEIREKNNLTLDWTLPNNNATVAIPPTKSKIFVNVYMTEDKLNKLMRDGLIQRRNGNFYYD